MPVPEPLQPLGEGERLLPAPGVSCHVVGDEGILSDERQGQVHVLNRSATQVWDLCQQGLVVSEVVARFAATHDRAPEQVAGDVRAVLSDFLARGLLQHEA